MKIAVLGNCQGDSLALCLRAMNPSLSVEFVSYADIGEDGLSIKYVLKKYDWVFSQTFIRPQIPAEHAHKVIYFPVVAFPAFHPDMAYLRGKRKGGELETVASPMVIYHSSIAMYCYKQGISLDDCVNWFNVYVYNGLGYLDAWEQCRQDLLDQGDHAGMPLGAMLAKWTRGGNFMHTINHPKLHVMADIARQLMSRANIQIVSQNAVDNLDDPLIGGSIWPLYPPIADRLDLHGDMVFKSPTKGVNLTLREFVEKCYAIYDQYERDTLEPIGVFQTNPDFARQITPPSPTGELPRNPYASAKPFQFWKTSVAGVAVKDLDPVVNPRFTIAKEDKIATAGSCFAQHIARTLAGSGFNYFVPESAPRGLGAEEAKAQNYGVYSARYGNIYTVRQLLQLLQRVQGTFNPIDEAWERKDGKLVDPFRPQIEPEGFADLKALRRSRDKHLAAVRKMITEMDVFVFTLGLTEGWRSRYDGAVFPLAPGVAGGVTDFEKYEFVNFTAEEINSDLDKVLDMLKVINPNLRVILTVSPVPLIATYETKHALVATAYSKAVLRTSADYAERTYSHVQYFPSYEIITGAYNKGAYYEDDLREVKPEGVAHVMGVFMRHLAETGETATEQTDGQPAVPRKANTEAARKKSLFDVACDEEAILNF